MYDEGMYKDPLLWWLSLLSCSSNSQRVKRADLLQKEGAPKHRSTPSSRNRCKPCAALRVLLYRCMARQLRSRERVFLGCLFCSVLYLLTYHNLSLGFSVTWSNSAVRRVQQWEGHRNLSLLVVVPAVCGELVPASESRCLQHISKVCPNFATRSCNVKKGISQSDACDQALLHQKGSNDIKQS